MDDAKNAARDEVANAWSAVKNRFILRWYRMRWLRFAGGVLVGVYGAFAWLTLVLGVLCAVHEVPGASAAFWISGGCALVALLGAWLASAE